RPPRTGQGRRRKPLKARELYPARLVWGAKFPRPSQAEVPHSRGESTGKCCRARTGVALFPQRGVLFIRPYLGSTPHLLLELFPPLHPLPDILLEAELGWVVPLRAAQWLGEILLRHEAMLVGVGVLVPRAVAQLLHERRGGVADVQWDAFGRVLFRRLRRPAERLAHAVRLGR